MQAVKHLVSLPSRSGAPERSVGLQECSVLTLPRGRRGCVTPANPSVLELVDKWRLHLTRAQLRQGCMRECERVCISSNGSAPVGLASCRLVQRRLAGASPKCGPAPWAFMKAWIPGYRRAKNTHSASDPLHRGLRSLTFSALSAHSAIGRRQVMNRTKKWQARTSGATRSSCAVSCRRADCRPWISLAQMACTGELTPHDACWRNREISVSGIIIFLPTLTHRMSPRATMP
jgi:hypothetical protein